MLRALASVLLLLVAAAALAASLGAPALTVEADALRLAYASSRFAAAVAAAILTAAAAALVRRRAAIGVLAVASAGALLHAASLATWTVRADQDALSFRHGANSRSVRWTDAVSVVNDPRAMTVAARDGSRVRIDVSSLEPQHRGALERTVARRIEAARAPH